MNQTDRNFDIILVLGYFRSATAFLSIIRYLSKDYRIGLLPTNAAESELKAKTGATHNLFLGLCSEFGAEILGFGFQYRTKLLLVQQFPYPDATARMIEESVIASTRVGLMTLAMAGLEKHDLFLTQFNIKKVYAPNKRFLNFLLTHRNANERYMGVEVEEVGLPFDRYPIFPHFRTDWLIAAPTLFSFHSEKEKHVFLRNVLLLLSNIPVTEKVVYKPHNSSVLDYFTPKFHYGLAEIILRIPNIENVLSTLWKILPWIIAQHLEKVLTGVLHLKLLQRARPLNQETTFGNISLEAFLPGVKKGVIGGLSNTIWGTIYFKLPFYNCVDPSKRKSASELYSRKSDNLLDLNLKFFGVRYCAGDIDLGDRGEKIIVDNERQGDIVRSLRQLLNV
jgi:hypothetical protein